MICVSIGRSRHKHMLAEHQHLCEQGAKLVELRLDYISSRVNIQRLLKDRPCPMIVTVRREQDGGKFTGDEDTRLMHAPRGDRQRRRVRRPGRRHRRRHSAVRQDEADHQLPQLPQHARQPPRAARSAQSRWIADIVKIATMANQPHDNVRVLEMMQESDVPTIGMCMGDIGTPSRILGPKFGAPFTYATFHHERALAPGQLSYEQMVEVYRHDSINPNTAVYGVIADPIGHSLSPQVHNAAFGEAGIDAVYVPFRVPIDTLGQFIEDVPRLGIRGLSVTIPHKEAIAKFLTKVDPAVKGIGAVNTVLFKDNEVLGYNTDYKAAMDSLESAFGAVGANPSPLKEKRVLVLGAGGVARAVMYGLERRGAKATIAGRTRSRAQHPGRHVQRPGRRLAGPPQRRGRHHRQLHADRHAPERRRNAVRQIVSQAGDDRVRHGLQSRSRRCC